ncbi:DASH family cryptochrome [Photobacterium alginatilyticum]|uniref:DASH family cryptochrome n=1 Tax=Photobacterium alginatilyticum TaxID=1775171 RepID=UPI004069472C
MITGLFLFQNDLRLHDNPALQLAAQEVDALLCVYCMPPRKQAHQPYSYTEPGLHRQQFMLQSLSCLNNQLSRYHQYLIVLPDNPLSTFPEIITRYNVTAFYRSQSCGYYENQIWQQLKQQYPYLSFTTKATHTIFEQSELPFDVNDLPATFSKFRKQVDDKPVQPSIPKVDWLPPPPANLVQPASIPFPSTALISEFTGGETEALQHLEAYFSTAYPSQYKLTRNALEGWDKSTKFSPWLALGCLSVRTLLETLSQYQNEIEQNASTEWIKFELLWREYFQWYAHCHQANLFTFKGIKPYAPTTSFYYERFRRWCSGNTPFPIVNACMNQLNQTGFMSNRGRQIVASCLINELSIDWRYGATYFEQHLIDYDVASNWGNWQYLAGVGADPKEHRHFNLQKQTEIYDPNHNFIRKWRGDQTDGNLDAVDAADWPIGFSDDE